MASYTLVSFKICPYVQRSVITLEEKGAPYEIKYIDLQNKPDWFLKLSPLGKVPILTVGDDVIFESAVIAEFIDEATPGTRLHPQDPLQRAHNRSWIEFVSSILVSSYKMGIAPTEAAAREMASEARKKLERLEGQLGDGPFFNGAAFSLVDAAAAPLLQRLTYCEEVVDLGIFAGLDKVSAWRDALLAHDSVKASTVPDIRDLYRKYLATRPEASWLGKQIAQ